MIKLIRKHYLIFISGFYRIASGMLTVVLIHRSDMYTDLWRDNGIILMMMIASLLILLLYSQVESHRRITLAVVYLEIIVQFFVYFLTGGLFSPLVWTIINPMIFMTLYSPDYRRVNVATFIVILILTSIGGARYVGYPIDSSVYPYLTSVFYSVMVLGVVSIVSILHKMNVDRIHALEETENELRKVLVENNKLKNWVTNSYDLIEELILIKELEVGVAHIFEYASYGLPFAEFYIVEKIQNRTYSSSVVCDAIMEGCCEGYTSEEFSVDKEYAQLTLGIVCQHSDLKQLHVHHNEIWLLLEICEIFFEKSKHQKENEVLYVKQEQRRIAGEIHDSISQDLHGVSYIMYDMIHRSEAYSERERDKRMKRVYNTIRNAGEDLKGIIYDLSDVNKIVLWRVQLRRLLIVLESQYNVEMYLHISRDLDFLHEVKSPMNDAFKRVIKEAVANAVQHGKAESVHINFYKEGAFIRLTILDDGRGFDFSTTKIPGLGHENMRKMAKVFNGDFRVDNYENGALLEMKFAYEEQ